MTASAVLAPIVVVGLIGAAAASEYRCVRGDQSVRRVEMAAEDPVQNVPCEVVYWKDTEQPGVRSVLWSAQTDAAYCTRKAEELVAKLEGSGWSCAPVEDAPTEAARETTRSVVESAPAKPEAETADAAGAARLESAPDEAAKAPEPAEREPPAFRAARAPQRSEPQPDASTAGASEDKPAGTVLEAIIEQNLVRLNDGLEGRFAADIGGYGDLDGDGLEDGLVFFTYESERLWQARFVAAYLYDGKRYALAATKPVAGSDVNVHSVDIDSIEDGIISLRLSVLEPGDASCCPSGEQQQRLVLRDGQLIEVTSSVSPMPGQAEQTLATKPSQEPLAPAVPRADGSGESEERAKSAGEERAAEAGGRQVETDAESPERPFETAARSGVATTGSLIANPGMPKEAKRTEQQPTTGRGAGTQIHTPQAAPAGKQRMEELGGPQGTSSEAALQAKADPALPEEAGAAPLESLPTSNALVAEWQSRPRPPAAAFSTADSGTLVGGSPSGAQASRAAPVPPGRSPQAAADPATPAAARLQAASEASSLDDPAAADIRVFIHHVAHHQGDAALARQLADHLQRRGFTVADIRPVDLSIGKPSVRYFFARNRAASRRLVEEVSRFFEETPSQAPDDASDFTHFMPKPRPGNVEVWLPAW